MGSTRMERLVFRSAAAEAGAEALPLWEEIWPGPAMKLVGPLAARSPGVRLGLRFILALEIERHCSADEIFQGRRIDLVAFVDVDGAPDIPVEAGVKQTCSVLQRSSLGKCHLDDVLVRFSRADDAAMGPDGSPHPLPLFGDLRVCFVYDSAHFRERLPAPVPKFLDLLVDECRCRFHRYRPFHVQLQAALSVTCKPSG